MPKFSTATSIQALIDSQYINTARDVFSLKRLASSILGDQKIFLDIENSYAPSTNSNKDEIVDIQLVLNDDLSYYVVYVPGEPVDFEHWESVENLFKEYNYTANWVGNELDRPKSDYIRWVEDIDDEVPDSVHYSDMSFKAYKDLIQGKT